MRTNQSIHFKVDTFGSNQSNREKREIFVIGPIFFGWCSLTKSCWWRGRHYCQTLKLKISDKLILKSMNFIGFRYFKKNCSHGGQSLCQRPLYPVGWETTQKSPEKCIMHNIHILAYSWVGWSRSSFNAFSLRMTAEEVKVFRKKILFHAWCTSVIFFSPYVIDFMIQCTYLQPLHDCISFSTLRVVVFSMHSSEPLTLPTFSVLSHATITSEAAFVQFIFLKQWMQNDVAWLKIYGSLKKDFFCKLPSSHFSAPEPIKKGGLSCMKSKDSDLFPSLGIADPRLKLVKRTTNKWGFLQIGQAYLLRPWVIE